MAINRFVIVGRVARELELRSTTNGKPVVTYPVAINRVWYSTEGERREECDFIPVTSYGAQAERDVKYLAKGSQVCVEGAIRSWYDAEAKRGGFNFEAERVQYLGGKPAAEPAEPVAG